jgi:hypothetical protein
MGGHCLTQFLLTDKMTKGKGGIKWVKYLFSPLDVK